MKAISLLLILSSSLYTHAKPAPLPKDPYQSIRYAYAFNQDDLWQQYHTLMAQMGCLQNISDLDVQYDIALFDEHTVAQQLMVYQDACMCKLNTARKLTLAEPGIYATIEIVARIAAAAAVMQLLGTESAGGSFAGFTAIFDSLRSLQAIIQTTCNLCSWPDNPLQQYEDCFAKNKCFIPHVLWPKIVQELISARQNEFSRQMHMDFLQFVLGFTTYKPQPKLQMNASSLDAIKDELSARIHTFFDHYTTNSCNAVEIQNIALNVAKFIDQLADSTTRCRPRYIYLHGPGGIGKTYFVQQLSQWIEELLPESVNFEAVVINSGQELEGNTERPGALLKVMHNQLLQNKRGSVVILDEATWLNDPAMRAAAKRTFNLDQSTLCTAYFGDSPDGAGVPIALAPMLIFVASNDEIIDTALASRFDSIHYPLPSKELLVECAVQIVQTSQALRRSGIVVDVQTVRQWIDTLTHEQCNFRFVASNVEAEFLVRAISA
jgi:hypothetical protein